MFPAWIEIVLISWWFHHLWERWLNDEYNDDLTTPHIVHMPHYTQTANPQSHIYGFSSSHTIKAVYII